MILTDKRRKLLYTLFILYLVLLSKLILIKFYNLSILKDIFINWSPSALLANIKLTNYIPFVSTYQDLRNPESLDFFLYDRMIEVYNVIAFLPFGFILPLLHEKFRSLAKVTSAAFMLSLCFEVIQLITTLGNFDVDSLILNTFGGMIGFWLVSTYLSMRSYLQESTA